MAINLARARALDAKYRIGRCTIRARTNTGGGKGGNRIAYADLHTGESCRIVADKSLPLESPAGGRDTAISRFIVHLRYDLTIAPSQVIEDEDSGLIYEIIDDISDPTNRYATLARCRRLT